MERIKLFEWVKGVYGTEPDYPWNDWNAVLRHAENKKWYALIMEVPAQKLGLDEMRTPGQNYTLTVGSPTL